MGAALRCVCLCVVCLRFAFLPAATRRDARRGQRLRRVVGQSTIWLFVCTGVFACIVCVRECVCEYIKVMPEYLTMFGLLDDLL